MDKVKWLLVGAGNIANKRVAPALVSAENSELIGVCDPHMEQASAMAEKFNIQNIYKDFEKALVKSNADAVYLATPIWLHADQAIAVLEAGKNVLIEKPLTLDGKGVAKVLAAAGQSAKIAACAYYRRCFERYKQVKQMLNNGDFGKVVSVRMTYFSWFSPEKNDPKYWRVIKEKSGGGPLSDMGTHMFDVLIGLFGLPVSVSAECDTLVNDWNVEDSAAVIMTLKNGALVTASFNWNSKTWRHEFEIVGTEAKIDWLPYDSGTITKTVGRQIDYLDIPEAENVHLPLIQNFVDAILNGAEPVCSIREAAKTNILLDAIYQSAACGKKVDL